MRFLLKKSGLNRVLIEGVINRQRRTSTSKVPVEPAMLIDRKNLKPTILQVHRTFSTRLNCKI